MAGNILIALFVLFSLIRLAYFIFFFSRIWRLRTERQAPEWLPPVSVLVCAKNEAANLRDHLKLLLIQQYPRFEVIVVDDQSEDDSLRELELYQKRNKNLRIISIKPGFNKPWPGKKFAVLQAVKAATYEHIVVTDADCRPDSFHWLSRLMAHQLSETRMVLGYGPFQEHPGMLNRLIRYENLHTAMQYFSYALAGLPYMGVGRNLAFRKEDYLNWKPSAASLAIASGDDDLFVNAFASASNTELCADKETFMYSEPERTYIGWLRQKTRHIRAGEFYKPVHKRLLGLYGLSYSGMYFSFLMLVLLQFELKWVVPYLLLWQLLALGLSLRAFKVFQAMNLALWFPVTDLLLAIQGLIVYLLALTKKSDRWK
jgi:glycosyltransferase involved in cell wall biosynthesis